jgi:hypothetical protein
MCDIKFRVWNRQSKEYITGNRVRVDGDGLLYIDRITVKNCFRPPHTRKNPWFIVEQYTGLKDKNGNEIFVNDIIEMHYFEQYAGPGEVEKTVVGVIGKDSMGCFTEIGDKKYYWLHYLEDAEYYGDAEYNEELELLGNIHENPELLEEK